MFINPHSVCFFALHLSLYPLHPLFTLLSTLLASNKASIPKYALVALVQQQVTMKFSILTTLVTVMAVAALPTAFDQRDSDKPSSIITMSSISHETNQALGPAYHYSRRIDCPNGVCWTRRCYYFDHLECYSDGICHHGYCYIDPPDMPPSPPLMVKRDELAGADDDLDIVPVCHNDIDCGGGYCTGGICIADPPEKRGLTGDPKDPNCYNDIDCEGGTCLNNICFVDSPSEKRDADRQPDGVILGDPNDPNCYGDIDCEGGSCVNNICVAKPTKRRDNSDNHDPKSGLRDIGGTCRIDKDCGDGNSCLSGVCIDKPPAQPPKSKLVKRSPQGFGEI